MYPVCSARLGPLVELLEPCFVGLWRVFWGGLGIGEVSPRECVGIREANINTIPADSVSPEKGGWVVQ